MACTTVEETSEYSGSNLPRPEQVIVYDFAASPEDVRLDDTVTAKAEGKVGETGKGDGYADTSAEVVRAVQEAFATELVKELQQMGLPARRATAT